MAENELFLFLSRTATELEQEYQRIRLRVGEDPGTAGDQGEENWATVFRSWLPSYYKIVTKGRILAADGRASPQVDLLVLSPSYPAHLLDKKLYLAGGVIAAFECKLTLRSNHLRKFFENSLYIRDMFPNARGNPRAELVPSCIYGLLAHSHEWQAPGSNPAENIDRSIVSLDSELLKLPLQMPDFVCISDLGFWSAMRALLPTMNIVGAPKYKFPNNYGLELKSAYSSALTGSKNQGTGFTPIGALLTAMYNRLAWTDHSMRSLSDYFIKANVAGRGSGIMRDWPIDVLSESVLKTNLKFRLTNGVAFDEWSMALI